MHERASLGDLTFAENGAVDVGQLNELYRVIGWDSRRRRTVVDTHEMLTVSRYYVAAQAPGVGLVGFARVCGDPYVVQVLDVITHPDFQRRGIATAIMRGVLEHLRRSSYLSVTLACVSELDAFYERLGFRAHADATRIWRP
jgi:GNAT superfamily N-acetyltransferase